MSSSLKKTLLVRKFSNILDNKEFFAFVSTTKFTIQDKVAFKKEFQDMGLGVIVLKNRLFIKLLNDQYPCYENLKPLIHGLCLFIYPEKSTNISIDTLKSLGSFIKKKEEFLFLGGLVNGELINQTYLDYILSLKDQIQIYGEFLSLLSSNNVNLVNKLNAPSVQFLNILKQKSIQEDDNQSVKGE